MRNKCEACSHVLFQSMLKYTNHDIVFQEFPDEVALAINLSRCPCACVGCHSAFLQTDVGEVLTPVRLLALLDNYRDTITCVGFMGGDNDPDAVADMAETVRLSYGKRLHIGWYSGRQTLPKGFRPEVFDYVKLGPYIAALGPLSMPTTNQRFYAISPDGQLEDRTALFWK